MLFLALILFAGVAFSAPEADLCPLCINTMDQSLEELLNIILNVGVIGSCGELCEYLEPKFGKIVAYACDIVCDYVGIELFIYLIQKADLDPIWMCQEIKLCPIHDCKADICANFTSPTIIRPSPGVIGEELDIMYTFTVYEQTGTGEVLLALHTSKGSMPPVVEGGELIPKGFEPGTFNLGFKITLKDDPEAEPPVEYRAGTFESHFYLCEGQCGSKHKHTRELAEQTDQFQMTK